MWKYLEKILGSSSKYYEILMGSRDSKAPITDAQIGQVVEIIQPLKRDSYEFEVIKNLPVTTENPKNKKQQPIPYFGIIPHPEYQLYLFLDAEKFPNDISNIHLVVEKKTATDFSLDSQISLPIWEEVIHHDSGIHHAIVDISPKHPWTLYARAKKQSTGVTPQNQIAGYPQWLVNDIDFRKIAPQEFLFQMQLKNVEQTLYYFYDAKKLTTEFFLQKF